MSRAKRKIVLSILIINDLFILFVSMLESGFWAKTIDERLTWNGVMPFHSGSEEIKRLDPFSGSFDTSFPILQGENIQELLTTFFIGLLIFFLIKTILGFVMEKIGVFEHVHADYFELKKAVKA